MTCVYISFTALLLASCLGSALYCQNYIGAGSLPVHEHGDERHSRCTSVGQFQKHLINQIPDIRGLAVLLRLERLAIIGSVLNEFSPSAMETIALMTIFAFAAIFFGAM